MLLMSIAALAQASTEPNKHVPTKVDTACRGIEKTAERRACQIALSRERIPESQCEKTPTQDSYTECAYREYLIADRDMNRAWDELAGIWRGKCCDNQREVFPLLLASQRNWIKYRDAQCAIQPMIYRGGAVEPKIYHSCMARMTRDRIVALADIRRSRLDGKR